MLRAAKIIMHGQIYFRNQTWFLRRETFAIEIGGMCRCLTGGWFSFAVYITVWATHYSQDCTFEYGSSEAKYKMLTIWLCWNEIHVHAKYFVLGIQQPWAMLSLDLIESYLCSLGWRCRQLNLACKRWLLELFACLKAKVHLINVRNSIKTRSTAIPRLLGCSPWGKRDCLGQYLSVVFERSFARYFTYPYFFY